MPSLTEQNYLKAIYHLQSGGRRVVNTNDLAAHLSISAASVTEMVKRLAAKNWIIHEKYKGVGLTNRGEKLALSVIRKHRLWEYFLVEKLKFSWDQVHDIAEELEHINSEELINRLDQFLGEPQFDPHGDPIPNKDGRFPEVDSHEMTSFVVGDSVKLLGVMDHSTSFFNYLKSLQINMGDVFEIKEVIEYDESYMIANEGKMMHIPKKVLSQLKGVKIG